MEICQWHISRDSKERTEATAEGARGSAANEVRRKTEPPLPSQAKY